jgi:hypothetical protein
MLLKRSLMSLLLWLSSACGPRPIALTPTLEPPPTRESSTLATTIAEMQTLRALGAARAMTPTFTPSVDKPTVTPTVVRPTATPTTISPPSSTEAAVRHYQNEQFQLSFNYTSYWTIEERDLQRSDPEVAQFQVLLQDAHSELVVISVFHKPDDLEAWLQMKEPGDIAAGQLDLTAAKGEVRGQSAYIWLPTEAGTTGVSLVFQGSQYIYRIGSTDDLRSESIQGLLRSVIGEEAQALLDKVLSDQK